METKEILSIKDVAELLRLTNRTVERYIKEGVIPAYRLPGGRRLYIKREDLLASLELVQPKTVAGEGDD